MPTARPRSEGRILYNQKGEKVAFVGKNGAGKSTMAKLICGIERPRQVS